MPQSFQPRFRQIFPKHFIKFLSNHGIVMIILMICFGTAVAAAAEGKAPAAALAPDSLKTGLQSVLATLRDAMLEEDFDKYIGVFSRNIRGNGMVRYWGRYKILEQEIVINKIKRINANNAVASTTWRSKTRNLETGEISNNSRKEEMKFTRQGGKWFIVPDPDTP